MGEWMNRSMISRLPHQLQVSAQLHASALFSVENNTRYPPKGRLVGQQNQTEPSRGNNILVPTGTRKKALRVDWPVAIRLYRPCYPGPYCVSRVHV
jgi:hypothetical protein